MPCGLNDVVGNVDFIVVSVVVEHPFSSALSKQSSIPSHLQKLGMHLLCG